MMYVWNGFAIVGKRADLTENLLITIEKEETALQNETGKWSVKMVRKADVCLLMFCEISVDSGNMLLNLSMEILEPPGSW